MARPPQSQSDKDEIDALAAAAATVLSQRMREAGIPLTKVSIMAVTAAVARHLERLDQEEVVALRRHRVDARTDWVQAHDLLDATAAARLLGLAPQELETATRLGLVTPAPIPDALHEISTHFTPASWQYYEPTLSLTDAERARVAHETLLTRAQAAERLGVTLTTFDRLRRHIGVQPVEQEQKVADSRQSVALYRLDEVDRLAATFPTTPRAPRPTATDS